MPKKDKPQSLGHRERQIMDVVYRRGEAAVGEVLAELPDPPGYSSVRKMLSLLEQKGVVRHRREGTRYIYRPTQSRQTASRRAVQHLLATFFDGSAADAVNAILDVSSSRLSDEEFARLRRIVDEARKQGQ